MAHIKDETFANSAPQPEQGPFKSVRPYFEVELRCIPLPVSIQCIHQLLWNLSQLSSIRCTTTDRIRQCFGDQEAMSDFAAEFALQYRCDLGLADCGINCRDWTIVTIVEIYGNLFLG